MQRGQSPGLGQHSKELQFPGGALRVSDSKSIRASTSRVRFVPEIEEMIQADTRESSRPAFQWTVPKKCVRNVTLNTPARSPVNCSTFSLANKVATASLRDLNRGVNCNRMDNGTYCLPAPCDVAMIWVDGGIPATDLIGPDGPYSDISMVQFMLWNAAALHEPVFPGDAICIG